MVEGIELSFSFIDIVELITLEAKCIVIYNLKVDFCILKT